MDAEKEEVGRKETGLVMEEIVRVPTEETVALMLTSTTWLDEE